MRKTLVSGFPRALLSFSHMREREELWGRDCGQQCCEKASAAFKSKTNSSIRINWFTHCLLSNETFSNEMNLRNPRTTDRGTQFNAAHAQLPEKMRLIAFAETCRFLTIQSLESQEIWPKNSLETTWMIYHEESEFWHREFLILQKTIYGELRKLLMLKFY